MKHRQPDHSLKQDRHDVAGFTLLELMVTLILLGSVMGTIVPLLSWVNSQGRAANARQIAVQEASNIFERLTARNWDEVTQATANEIKLTAVSQESLREPRLKVTVSTDQKQPTAKRITVELRWKNREGDDLSPVRLTSFVYRKSRTP